MSEIRMNEAGKNLLDKVVAIWPAILQGRRKEKILHVLSMVLALRKKSEAGPEEVKEAIQLVVPKSYDPFFHMLEDMDTFKRLALDIYNDMDAYRALPVRVRRWERPPAPKPSKPPEQMKVTAFCASPRKNGNTELLIDEALAGAASAGARGEKIMLQKTDLRFCVGCRKCKDEGYKGMCTVKDGMTGLYDKIIASDAIIIGFPIYTGRECAQLSTFLDRWDCFERYKFQASLAPGRRALVIGTWGYPYIDTYDHVMENVMLVLKLHKVETVEALSACGFEGMLHGLDEKRRGTIAQFPAELRKAFEAGAGLVTGK